MEKYIVTMKHDAGVIRILTSAQDADTAVKMVADAEYAPLSAVVNVEQVE